MSFWSINKSSAGPVSGTFNGLAEGAFFVQDGVLFSITYLGGDGNDVVLTVHPDTTADIDVDGNLVITDATTDSTDDLTITDDGTFYIIT
ncbi:MAG: hypothetical protein R6X05_01135, partial [Desulfobacterales bacterium]